MRFLKIFIIINFAFLSNSLLSQSSYMINFNGNMENWALKVVKGYNNEFEVIIFNFCRSSNDTCRYAKNYIYSFNSQDGNDTVRWPVNFNRTDTIINPKTILFDDSCYLVGGSALKYDDNDSLLTRYDFLAKYDLNKNKVWEKYYERPPELQYSINAGNNKLIKLNSGNYLFACPLWESDQPSKRLLLRSFNGDGDILYTRFFSPYLTGDLQSITYNIDSSAILLHMSGATIPGCINLQNAGIGALVIDTVNFDTIGGICYRQNFKITDPYDAELDGYGNMILAGVADIFNFTTHENEEYTCVYKLNSNYQVIKQILLTDKNKTDQTGLNDCLDINNNHEIFIGGVVNNVLDVWPQTYDLFYVAKLDKDFNVLAERYFGGDSYYKVKSITALNDGGLAIVGISYDYKVNNYEHDAFIIKTDADLWVNTDEHSAIPVHSVLIYPNPGNGNLNIRTTEKASIFKLYNLAGKEVKQLTISQHITNVDCTLLPQGVYLWKLFKNNREIDRGKWIKL